MAWQVGFVLGEVLTLVLGVCFLLSTGVAKRKIFFVHVKCPSCVVSDTLPI